MIYSEPFTIPNYLCDSTDHLSLWGSARLLQEIAEHHCVQNGLGFHHLVKINKSWVLTQMLYLIEQRPKVGDTIMLTTWSRNSDGLYAYRDSQITNLSGQPLISTTATWVLIDRQSRKVARLHNLMDSMDHNPRQATPHSRPPKLIMPQFTAHDCNLTLQVQPTMLDHVLHVNNAEYIRWIDDQMQTAAPNTAIHQLNIKFAAETPPHDSVSISRKQINHSTYIQISNSRGVAVDAEIQ